MTSRDLRTSRRPCQPPGAVLLLAAMVVLHTGSALATTLFDAVSPAGITWLRLAWAALLLLAVSGRSLWPVLREASHADLLAAALLGAVSAGMMLLFSEAVARIPLGTATALEFLGPLVVAVASLRQRAELVWIVVAAAGVVLLTSPWTGDTDSTGVLFALGAAACWALYIIGTQHVGGRFSAQHGLALSLTVAAACAAPFGVRTAVTDAEWNVIWATAGIALLMPLVPFLFEMKALQRMGKTTYGTLTGLEPGVSMLAGLALIAQTPTAVQTAGTALVVTAGIGAARGQNRMAGSKKRIVSQYRPERARRRYEPIDRTARPGAELRWPETAAPPSGGAVGGG